MSKDKCTYCGHVGSHHCYPGRKEDELNGNQKEFNKRYNQNPPPTMSDRFDEKYDQEVFWDYDSMGNILPNATAIKSFIQEEQTRWKEEMREKVASMVKFVPTQIVNHAGKNTIDLSIPADNGYNEAIEDVLKLLE